MEYGRLSSLFWGQLDRERRELNEHSPANGEAYLTVSVSEWDALTTALVNQLPNKSLEKDAGSLLSAFRGLVKKNLDADAAHSQIDDTAASTLKALKECSVRMIGKKEKDALRKYFYAADSVDSFGQAALPIIRQLSELISQERWNEIWRTTLDRAQSSSRLITAFVENLQGVLTGGHDILQELELVPPQYGTATNKVLEEIKNCFIPEPVAVAPAKAAPPPKPEISRHTRSQPPSGTSGDLVRILLDTQFVSSDGSQPALDVFVPAVEGLLIGDKSEEELQSELFEILGYDNFDLITSLLANRSGVRRNVESRKQKAAAASSDFPRIQDGKRGKNHNKRDTKNEWQIPADLDIEAASAFDDDYAAQLQYQEIRATQRESIRSYERPRYPYVFDQMAEAKESAAFIQGAKLRLPDHTVRQTKLYEEYNVPAPNKSTLPTNLPPLIRISEMDDVIRHLFEGYETLNRIQSMVYTTAYTTNENMLVCAPTGAGKTNTAMLCIAREIRQNLTAGNVLDPNLKIVYVAPMKALASEMVRTFTERLKFYKLRVEEVTGDTNVNKFDLEKTQMIITTPEKWDVITRKSVGDTKLVSQVSLLIIDEIHLLNDERGPVIEGLIARTFHMIEENQKMVRILGLSATLPNYVDVADFLHVKKEKAMFYFDGRFRPVPLEQTFIGMKQQPSMKQDMAMYEVLYEKLLEHVRKNYQVLVFVHARNQTHKVANTIREMAIEHGELDLFRPNEDEDSYDNRNLVSRKIVKQMQDHASKTTNRELRVLLPDGLAIHHAGMIRADRHVVERMFKEGGVRVLVCTATLAWGVNLPAHAVIIHGTKIYKPEKGSFDDIDVLDVQQIFGRAGRPQYDTSGHGIIITTHEAMPKFLKMMTSSQDIESQMPNHLLEHLNAEISLRNVSNVGDAVRWLNCTYLAQRISKNCLMYGFDRKKASEDLAGYTRKWFEEKVHTAGRELEKARLVRYDEKNGFFNSTQYGNIASWFYIDVKTMQVFTDDNTGLRDMMQEYEILALVCKSSEFSQIKVRNEELPELDEWKQDYGYMPRAEAVEDQEGKVSILIQSYISKCVPRTHSLSSDMYYCQQNAARILRAIFQMANYKNWSSLASKTLNLCLYVENRIWAWDHPLKQLGVDLPMSVYGHLEAKKLSIERLKDLDEGEIGVLVNNRSAGKKVKNLADQYPILEVDATAKPIGNAVIQINLSITPKFNWNDSFLGSKRVLNFWIWAADPNSNVTFHTEEYALQKVKVLKRETDKLDFIIPSYGSHEILVHIRSDKFLHSSVLVPVYLRGLRMPKHISFKTELLDLQPLPTSALQDPKLEALYPFQHFNPIQTQVFHTLMHTDHNVLLGAPTGSGKTIAAELAIFRALRVTKCKVVYIAPLKALVRERVADWKDRLEQRMGWKVVELTGDTAPDIRIINAADVIIATPEKWDGISRSWQHRSYVQDVKLLVFDEIHMLGESRGPVIEVIVSRTNFIASFTHQKVRIVGLSTALASADDVASWLGIRPAGLFNFSSAVRPVPLVQHIQGYAGKHYCPRMALMNKPTYQAIRTHSAGKPVLIFVSSRRQTRLTGFALLSFASMEYERGREWMTMTDDELTQVTSGIRDVDLKQLLMYGIGIHHAGLHERDRVAVEHLFLNGKILILIATATLAWGVNFPAHLVVIKGTEFYDGKTKQYVKYPLTDVLQMAGRAGRPQFDNEGVAVILCHEPLKNYYMKFLHNPLPVESQLQDVLSDHINAEIVAGTLTTMQSTMEYLTWTYFYRRLLANPDYYFIKRQQSLNGGKELPPADEKEGDKPIALVDVQKYLRELIMECLNDLAASHCIEYYQSAGKEKGPDFVILPTYLGTISSYYYLKHGTMKILNERLSPKSDLSDLLLLLCDVKEFDEMPVRHNEDAENGLLSKKVPLPIEMSRFDDPHAKVFLLLQVYLSRNQIPMPHVDYATDLKTALDQVMRVVQAMIDVSAQKGYLATTLRIMQLSQMLSQGQWIGSDPFYTLPFSDSLTVQALRKIAPTLPELVAHACAQKNQARLRHVLSSVAEPGKNAEAKILEAINSLPVIRVQLRLKVNTEEEEQSDNSTDQPAWAEVTCTPGRRDWITVPCGASCTLEVISRRLVKRWMPGKKTATSRFPKPKDESWWLVVGEPETGELCALKRIGFIGHEQNASILIPVPTEARRQILYLYLMSDSYFQFDQQIPIHLEAVG